jgi:hypothetical protein
MNASPRHLHPPAAPTEGPGTRRFTSPGAQGGGAPWTAGQAGSAALGITAQPPSTSSSPSMEETPPASAEDARGKAAHRTASSTSAPQTPAAWAEGARDKEDRSSSLVQSPQRAGRAETATRATAPGRIAHLMSLGPFISLLTSRLELRASRRAKAKDAANSMQRLHKHARTREPGRKISGYVTASKRERRTCARLLHERIVFARTPAFALLGGALVALSCLATAPSAQAETCLNEALRAENNSLTLPDCRAYERVTPDFQNGFGAAEIKALDPGGQNMIVTSIAGFAGAESNRLGPAYKLTRTAAGWQTASIAPPATLYPGNLFYSASEDLGKSLWALRSGTESIYAQNLYLREPGGTFVKVGSMVPPSSEVGPRAGGGQFFLGEYAFRGASRDLSHVFFSIHNGVGQSVVWPGDTTASFAESAQGFSLYEYTGVGNARPALVGLDTQGQLISNCATFLGSHESHEMYNAVSADGAKAFFTAEGHEQEHCPAAVRAPAVSEVYARLGGGETVAISEPVFADCEECLTVTRQPAQFQGASADGEKVFFTTTQELLPHAETENLYEFDFAAGRGARVRRLSLATGAPGTSAAEVAGVARISEDGSHVYFVARGRLTDEPRGGGCIAEETLGEQVEEEETHEGRCRPKQAQPNMYVYARDAAHPLGQVSFVATLAESTETHPQTDESDWGSSDHHPVQATPDGRRLVFDSTATLTQDVTGEGPQVYEYDAQTEELIRVSRGGNGYPQGTENANNSFAFIGSQGYDEELKATASSTFLAITDDGADVMFSTRAALTETAVAAAEHGVISVYVFHAGGPLSDGDVSLLSSAQATASSKIQGIARSGADAFFATTDPIAGGREVEQKNLFDARVGGGFPAATSAAGCEGESCLEAAPPSLPPPPPPGTLAATAGNGPSNVNHCPKGKVKKNGKCVAKKHTTKHHKKSKKPHAKVNRVGAK